ncbi:MAG: LytTR family transcriptional regulator [Defluviitaleaceae bacterium]|nr:LytTR family transcriptional regulator [Defluviitaleaceae bacterium]MCL2835823.1 LytTR family transcriptional regulator [Defluviitaleaceae bacterium]
MRLILKQLQDISETEVEIRYAQMDARIHNLIKQVEQSKQYLYGMENGRQHRILVNDIFYAESVDRKTYIYTKLDIFHCELKLYQILMKNVDFVQASKSCVVNINVLENIRTLLNSRMEGTLINGEKITISRTYIPGIRAAFTEKGGDAE